MGIIRNLSIMTTVLTMKGYTQRRMKLFEKSHLNRQKIL